MGRGANNDMVDSTGACLCSNSNNHGSIRSLSSRVLVLTLLSGVFRRYREVGGWGGGGWGGWGLITKWLTAQLLAFCSDSNNHGSTRSRSGSSSGVLVLTLLSGVFPGYGGWGLSERVDSTSACLLQ